MSRPFESQDLSADVCKGQAVLMLPNFGYYLGLSEDILNSVLHFWFKVA